MASREYGVVHTSFWTSADVRDLSCNAKLLFLYLLTGPHSNGLGCFRLPIPYMSADFKDRYYMVEDWLEELMGEPLEANKKRALKNGSDNGSENGSETDCENGSAKHSGKALVRYCEQSEFVFIPNYLKFNPIANPNCGKAIAKLVDSIPDNFQFFSELLEKLEPFSNRLPKRLANRLPNRIANQDSGFRIQDSGKKTVMPHSGECGPSPSPASLPEPEEPEPEPMPEPEELPEADDQVEPAAEEMAREFRDVLGIGQTPPPEEEKQEKPRKGDPIRKSAYSEEFEAFWKACHSKARKCGKRKAFNAWKTAKSCADWPGTQAVMAVMKKQVAVWQRETDPFVCYASTWLTQGRWDTGEDVEQEVEQSSETERRMAAARAEEEKRRKAQAEAEAEARVDAAWAELSNPERKGFLDAACEGNQMLEDMRRRNPSSPIVLKAAKLKFKQERGIA